MRPNINEMMWLEDVPPMAGQPDMGAGQPPTGQPGAPGDPMGQNGTQMQPNQMQGNNPGPQDLSNDPQFPEMPGQQEEIDFEQWKVGYVKESIKGDPANLINLLLQVRDRELEPVDRKFVEENLQINFLRRNASLLEASTEIRKEIKKAIDRTMPGKDLIGYITAAIEKNPLLNEVYIKCSGLTCGRLDAHRKLIASLIGAIQVGSGIQEEDLVFEETDYSIRISTRFNARWGDVNLGRWFQKEDDPEKNLKPAELDRLENGSPEEKDVLRRRIVIQSIAEQFKQRAFILNVVGQEGAVYHVGWDFGTSLKSAFTDGKLVVRTRDNDEREAFIDEEGSIIPIPGVSIYYVRETGQMDANGKPIIEEVEFIAHRDGMLYLTAQWDLIKEAAVSMEGILVKETAFAGNPSDLMRLRRCVPSLPEMILRDC